MQINVYKQGDSSGAGLSGVDSGLGGEAPPMMLGSGDEGSHMSGRLRIISRQISLKLRLITHPKQINFIAINIEQDQNWDYEHEAVQSKQNQSKREAKHTWRREHA